MLSHCIKIILWLQCCPSELYQPDAVSVFNNKISERHLIILEYTEGDVLTLSGLQMCVLKIQNFEKNTEILTLLLVSSPLSVIALLVISFCIDIRFNFDFDFDSIPTLNNQTQYYFRNPVYLKRICSTLLPVPSANNRRWNKLSCVQFRST